jgi:NADH pyrophosphatase NudC (nudix superfamily)
MERIQRAARVGRSRSAALPFTNSWNILTKDRDTRRVPPSVFYCNKSANATTSLVCLSDKFLFEENNNKDWSELVTETYSTRYMEIHLLKELPKSSTTTSTRMIANHYADDEVALGYLAHASSFLDSVFHAQYCGRCGAPRSLSTNRCSSCQVEKYPRMSPSAIVLVYDPWTDSVLFGKNGGKWSLLAGFCEPLESLENCAVREIMEESSIQIDRSSIEICATQPWPFFNTRFEGISLVTGCYALTAAKGQKPKAKIDEIEDVRWETTNELEMRMKNAPESLPMKNSMSRFLLQTFIESK